MNQPISVAQRRNARVAALPHIACGSTDPATSAWTIVLDTQNEPVGLELIVDTSAAHFAIAPCYTVQVIGDRFFSSDVAAPFMVDGFISVTDATANGFTLHMLTPPLAGGLVNPAGFFQDDGRVRKAFAKNGWSAVWFGMEP